MQFLNQTFTHLVNCTKKGVFGSCSNRPIHRYKTKNVVLVITDSFIFASSESPFLNRNVAKSKLLWAKLMSGWVYLFYFIFGPQQLTRLAREEELHCSGID